MKYKAFLIFAAILLSTSFLFSCGNENGESDISLNFVNRIIVERELPMGIPYPIKSANYTPPAIPQPPQILNYEGNCSGIYVEWQEEPNAERYFIKYRDESGYETTFDPEDLDPYFTYGEIMDITIPDLVEGEAYDVCVMAWNTDGMSGCNDSNPVDNYGWQFDIELLGLGIPSGLALSYNSEMIEMIWNRVECADDGYEIEINNDGYIVYETEPQLGDGYTHITHTYAAIAGETYSIRVRSLRGSEVSDWGPAEIVAPEGPEIGLNSQEFILTCVNTRDAESANLRITNEGGGTLHWVSSIIGDASSWLGMNPTNGYLNSGDYEFTNINVTCADLDVGQYTGTIRISDFDSGNYEDVTVNLTVGLGIEANHDGWMKVAPPVEVYDEGQYLQLNVNNQNGWRPSKIFLRFYVDPSDVDGIIEARIKLKDAQGSAYYSCGAKVYKLDEDYYADGQFTVDDWNISGEYIYFMDLLSCGVACDIDVSGHIHAGMNVFMITPENTDWIFYITYYSNNYPNINKRPYLQLSYY